MLIVRQAAVLLVVTLAFCLGAFPQTYLFDHYNISNGLPSNWVTGICQDSRGHLWVGGDGGMAVYDGVAFKQVNTEQGTSLPMVWSVMESRSTPGTVYAGTHGGGLRKLRGGKVSTIRVGDTQNSNIISTILEDRTGVLWCGTLAGVYRVEHDSARYLPVMNDTGFVTMLHETRNGTILIGFERSLYEYMPSRSTLARVKFPLPNHHLLCVAEDSTGTLWFGTQEGTILKVVNGKIVAQVQSRFGPLTSVAADRDGNLWFASDYGIIRVSKANFSNDALVRISIANGLREEAINVCTFDREDNLWIGGRSKGLSKLAYRNILRFQIENLVPDILNKSVVVDPSGHLFVAGSDGVWEFWKDTADNWKQHEHRLPSFGSRTDRANRGAFSVAFAPDGSLWVASESGGLRSYHVTSRPDLHSVLTLRHVFRAGVELPKGPPLGFVITENNQLLYNIRLGPLVQLDLSTLRVVGRHTIGGENIGGGTAQAICEMPNGDVWIGRFNGGVLVLSRDGTSYKHARVLTERDGLASDRVRSIVRRRNGDIWIGTRFNGISVYRNGAFQTVNETQGLLNNAVWKMAEDEEGRMWVGTSIGVQHTNPDGVTFLRDPRLSGEQVSGIGFLPGRHTLWTLTGGTLTLFDYRNEYGTTVSPLVAMEGLRINGIDRGVESGQRFSHSENFCVIRFNGISFKDPEGLAFRYRLLGLDSAWLEPTRQRTATFASLRPGAYVFEVEAMTADGTRSDSPARLAFAILPPWYLSPWALGVYVVVGALFVFSYTKIRIKKLEQRSHELERIVAERTAEVVAQRNRLHEQAEQLRELDVQKSHFFANISHEFRTPLTVILGHLDRLMGKAGADQVKDYMVMDRNARRLLHFINQLLDLSKIEAGGMTLRAVRSDIVGFIKRTTASLSSYAHHKGIRLTFNSASPDVVGHVPVFAYFDHDKIEKVLVNLLSNALKFTPHGGSVDVSLASGVEDEGRHWVEIAVADTGTGIPDPKLPYVFDRFYQVEDYTRPGYEGTGIGLALVKELVELHHGRVSVQSNEGKGTTFLVRLPPGSAHLDEGEIVADARLSESQELRIPLEVDSPIPAAPVLPEVSDEARVLVVEDNADLRDFIRDQLAGEYTIIAAANGVEGMRAAEEFMPDIIISDIMMPEMDGYSLCRMIKSSEKTSHIPVILLTAKATTANKIEGLELGADDYLMKPFNPQELQARVRNLIHSRKQLREKFSGEMLLRPAEVIVPSQQKVFLERVAAIIEHHLAEEAFSVEILADEIGMSRSQLHRKLKALTNKGPNELIRSFRLQRAAELIRQDAGSLAEIAYQVGFSSQAYFTRSFGEEFGVSPSEYKKARRTSPP